MTTSPTLLKYVEYEKYTQHNKNIIWYCEINVVAHLYVQIKAVVNMGDDDDEFQDVLQGLVDITARKVHLCEFPRAEILVSLYDEYTNDVASIPYMFMDVFKENDNIVIKRRDDKLQEIHIFPSLNTYEPST
jgi:hypothetical protein